MNLIAVILLLAANAFFVAAEFALVKVRGVRLDTLQGEGRFGAALSIRIIANLESYLAACQLGITMASLGLGWVGEPAVAAMVGPLLHGFDITPETLHTISFLIGFITFSSLHIVIGEQVPKTFAIREPEVVSLAFAYPLHAFYILMFPLNWMLNRASRGILALFGVKDAGHAEVLSGAELRDLVSLSQVHGAIENNQATMLANLFAFDERTVGRVMIPRRDVVVLNLRAEVQANNEAITDSGHSRFPVLDGEIDVPVGILLVKEFYRVLLRDGAAPWDDLMQFCHPPLVVPETLRIGTLFETMKRAREHMAVVVDEYGAFVGIVTLEDLIEEIVGEIDDELDEEAQRYPIETLGAADWSIHGLASLADVQRATGLTVPDALDANTLSGLFLVRLARMPVVGDRIQEGEFELVVDEMSEHHVSLVQMTRTTTETVSEPTPEPTPESTPPEPNRKSGSAP